MVGNRQAQGQIEAFNRADNALIWSEDLVAEAIEAFEVYVACQQFMIMQRHFSGSNTHIGDSSVESFAILR